MRLTLDRIEEGSGVFLDDDGEYHILPIDGVVCSEGDIFDYENGILTRLDAESENIKNENKKRLRSLFNKGENRK